MTAKHVLVAGASGLVGYAAMKHFAGLPDVKVTAVSRRKPFETFGAHHVSIDLADRDACAALFGTMPDITHVVYAALYEQPELVTGWRADEQIARNDAMLRNLLDPVLETSSGLRHVSLLQGTKAYGAHVRKLQVPAREDRSEARDIPNFYWNQEDYLRERQGGQPWTWTIFRPQIIFGQSFGSAMNPIPAIGAYAAVLKERGEPLHFPGGPANVLQAVDADLLARSIAWAGDAEAACNQALNVTNGDVFVWENVWPAIADALGMKAGEARPTSLAQTMPGQADVWDRIRQKYDLAAPPLLDYIGASFQYADYIMAHGAKAGDKVSIVSTVKIRQAGFGEAMDTEHMFRKWFRLFQHARLLPPVV